MSGDVLVSMARSDVASSEEAALSARAAGRTGSRTLQVRPVCPPQARKLQQKRPQHSSSCVKQAATCSWSASKAGGDGELAMQGILHAGAVLDSATITGITAASIRQEFSGKAHGGWNLLQLSARAPLLGVHLFSSLAAFSGSGGQGSYAAANAALDGWAQALQVRLQPDQQLQSKERLSSKHLPD